LGGGGNLLVYSEMGEEGFDLWRAHGGAVAQFVEADETFVSMEIRLFGAMGIAAQAVSKFFLRHGSFALDFWELLWDNNSIR
jgi:hypothetical protein